MPTSNVVVAAEYVLVLVACVWFVCDDCADGGGAFGGGAPKLQAAAAYGPTAVEAVTGAD